jgi:hypothetical protein
LIKVENMFHQKAGSDIYCVRNLCISFEKMFNQRKKCEPKSTQFLFT